MATERERLVTMLRRWSESSSWECLFGFFVDWKRHAALASDDVGFRIKYPGMLTGMVDLSLKTNKAFAENARGHWNKLRDEYLDLRILFEKVCPSLLGHLPAIREFPEAGDVKEVANEMADRVQAALGHVLATKDKPTNRNDVPSDEPLPSPDFTSISYLGVTYTFSAGQQRKIVEALWNERAKGSGTISEQRLGKVADSTATPFSMAKTFRVRGADGKLRTHPAIGTVIVPVGPAVYAIAPKKKPT